MSRRSSQTGDSSPTLGRTPSLPSSPRQNLKALRMPATPKPSAVKDITTDRDAMDGLHPVDLYQTEKPHTIGNDPVAIVPVDVKQPFPTSNQYPVLPKTYAHAQTISPISPGGGSQGGDSPPYYPGLEKGQPMGDAPASNSEKRIFGLRRTTFLLTLSNILLAIVLIAVAATQAQQLRAASSGAAASMTAQTNGGQTSSETQNPQTMQPAQPPQVIPAAFNGTGPHVDSNKNICFGTQPLPKAFGLAQPECPGSNGTIFSLPGSNLMYQRLCNMDLPGDDMARVPMTDFKDCIALCAFINMGQNVQGSGCQGVTWVFGDGPQGTGVNFCFPKPRRDNFNPRAGAESAILVD